ncbi:MAG: hypothetical protein RQ826_08270 [Xanthomonadales bacterium]|nr:hypothetical protein [Xanthomonadales bacterium]
MLLLSLITLFAGPLLFQWLSASRRLAETLEKVVVAVLILLVGVFLIPEIIEPLGAWALGLLFAGYLLPGLLERAIKKAAERLHLFSLYLALAGLLLHALLDGAGLAGSQIQADSNLALAIVLHRFGMGLMLWMIMQPVFGSRVGWLTLFAMAAATILGYEFSENLLPLAGDTVIAAIEGVIIGTILHSLVHRGHVHRQA